MNDDLGYGLRLSDEEYDERIIELHRGMPLTFSKEQELKIRQQELELAIEHRLGRDFPRSKREALWAIQQKVDKKRFRLIFKYMLRKFFASSLARDAQGLAGYLVHEYAKVLSQKELESFFGAEESRHPALPIDLEQLKK
ncbi:MAG: hypothetical protein D4R48_01005 [Nitrosomonadales bacterium]|nr:MAG: hypothetical protein D4R48_01005 [Nitrosomonadales bacterium]